MSTRASQITSDCLFNQPFVQIEKTSKLHITGLWEGNSLVTSEFPKQRARNTENVSIWRCYHAVDMMYHPENAFEMSSAKCVPFYSSPRVLVEVCQQCILQYWLRKHVNSEPGITSSLSGIRLPFNCSWISFHYHLPTTVRTSWPQGIS